jgi:hypothetical protein
LVLDHVAFKKLDLSGCSLGDDGLTKLWCGLAGQADSLETLNTSDNQGVVKPDIIRHSLSQLRVLKRLDISGNTRLDPDRPVIDEATISRWSLVELDLSGIALNEASIDVLADYLQTIKSQNLQILRLNKCGLTSRQIARIFRAMGQSRKMTVFINANRLDDGIDDLSGALACGYGPWSLFAQMVEFNYESSYTKLWKALTVNKTIECLSLAGSSTPDAASWTACSAVSEFFTNNETVRFLDISGYDAKLDEGRLGKEFSRALSGMRDNTKIEHLRVRSQMLNVNIGDLAQAISGNKTLHTLDCEDNDFNLSNYRHLVKSLTDNTTIRHFSAFSPPELEKSMRKTIPTPGTATPTRRSSVIARFRHEKPNKNDGIADKAIIQQLKGEWEASVAELELILERNRRLYDDAKHSDDESGMINGRYEEEGGFSLSFGGLAFREYESRRRKSSSVPGTPTRPRPAPITLEPSIARSNSTISSEAAVSPTSPTGSFASPDRTPSDSGSPTGKTFPAGSFDQAITDNYTYTDGYEPGLYMKTTRRPFGEAVGRIEEEE